jgi:SAM-dependent methyltransferase
MSNPVRRRWEEKYQREAELWLEKEPRKLLKSFAYLLPGDGRALDAASGVGNNAVFLARKGLRVFALDISESALRLAKQRTKFLPKPLEAAVVDLSKPWLPADYFDVIINFHFLERATFPVYRKSLRLGGLLFFDTFTKPAGDFDSPEYYLQQGELFEHFQDYEVIHYREDQLPPTDTHPKRGLAQLVARKSQSN